MLGIRHLVGSGAIALALSGLASGVASSQDLRLVAQCGSPQLAAPADASAPRSGPAATTVSCNLWATDAVTFKGVRATLKGSSDPLDVRFEPRNPSLSAMFVIQVMDPSRRAMMTQMLDTVVRIADARDANRRFAAYSVANDLNLVADFGASKADFDKQIRAIRAAALPTQLYKGAIDAIAKLARQRSDRKALIILGDGNSDDQSYDHDNVVKAAKEAGVIIHALGFTADASDLPKFQNIRRLADDTGGFRREVRVGGTQRYTIGGQFVGEALENGGTARLTLREPPGPVTVSLVGEFASGRSESVDQSFNVPAAPLAPAPTKREEAAPRPLSPPQPEAWYQRLAAWAQENKVVAVVSSVAVVLGTIWLALFAVSSHAARQAQLQAEAADAEAASGVVYGWLDMLDGNASRYPLQTTNVRIGRHRDNDICLLNDSISRRHALLHFNAESRRFVITDLGGGNGVVVNKVRQKSHDLKDGDLVELGEVRLRFRANAEALT